MLSVVLISRNCGLIKVLNVDSSPHVQRNSPSIRSIANKGWTPQLCQRTHTTDVRCHVSFRIQNPVFGTAPALWFDLVPGTHRIDLFHFDIR
ncbi:hypothetical protein AVEN_74470-1 [Araneus ventricosus]|uniref:Uncharacterized protein n=1 Tax=Araneus ventricosus TaxID=182803 RepID=A0A4Y2PV59_ARAVE|nr:hypothetical protein AVEN_74470-1 [Araneus ventricosus]